MHLGWVKGRTSGITDKSVQIMDQRIDGRTEGRSE